MIDPTGVIVGDLGKSTRFYAAALKPMGYKMIHEFPASVTGNVGVAGFGEPPKADFWISVGIPNQPPTHVAFRVGKRFVVDAFHRAAVAAGGKNNGAPGLRPQYHHYPNYYGSFVLDPDGHNIEVICHNPE